MVYLRPLAANAHEGRGVTMREATLGDARSDHVARAYLASPAREQGVRRGIAVGALTQW